MVTLGTGTVTDAARMIMWPVSDKWKKAAFRWILCCISGNLYFQKQITILDDRIPILIPYNNPGLSDQPKE